MQICSHTPSLLSLPGLFTSSGTISSSFLRTPQRHIGFWKCSRMASIVRMLLSSSTKLIAIPVLLNLSVRPIRFKYVTKSISNRSLDGILGKRLTVVRVHQSEEEEKMNFLSRGELFQPQVGEDNEMFAPSSPVQ